MKEKATWFIKNLEEIVAAFAIGLMTTFCCVNVILRVFSMSQIILSELTQVCMTWATFIGMAAAYKRNQHFGMDFLPNHLPKNLRMVLRAAITLLLLVLFVFLAVVAWEFSLTATKHTAVAEIPYTYINMAAAFGFTSMAIYSAIYLGQFFFAKEKFAARYASADEMADTPPGTEMPENT